MAFKLRLKRGLSTRFDSVKLENGEPAFLEDIGKLYIGNGKEKVLINPDIPETAKAAEKLANEITISLEGDITGDFSFDGSESKSAQLELKSIAQEGTYSKVEIDNKGRVIKGAALSENDIPEFSIRKIVDAGTAARRNIGTESGNIPVLGADGKLSNHILPPLAISDIFTVDSENSMLGLPAQRGDVAIRTDLKKTFILSNDKPGLAESWTEILTPTGGVQSVNGQAGAVSLTYSDVEAAASIHSHDDSEIATTFEESELRENINSGEKLSTALGKVMKWFKDFKKVAFSGSYKDLSDKPDNANETDSGLMSAESMKKLKDIEENANYYVHSSGDGNLHVPATGTGNKGKVLTAGDKAGIFSWQTLSITASNAKPKMNGTEYEGTESKYSRADHIHPTDTSRAGTALATTSKAGLMSPEDKVLLEELKNFYQTIK